MDNLLPEFDPRLDIDNWDANSAQPLSLQAYTISTQRAQEHKSLDNWAGISPWTANWVIGVAFG